MSGLGAHISLVTSNGNAGNVVHMDLTHTVKPPYTHMKFHPILKGHLQIFMYVHVCTCMLSIVKTGKKVMTAMRIAIGFNTYYFKCSILLNYVKNVSNQVIIVTYAIIYLMLLYKICLYPSTACKRNCYINVVYFHVIK